ncbi:MAG: S-adenosyl-l-methionine hydroxide adenosyltransferase family protein [Desulfobulbaceae bacterium]|nr:S-adenosyl-l-methionine hydroxide adenosyltransferase family protein [Desulfobulbaceae bacterium]
MITLTTDFGMSDEYAGVMKGVIYTICPTARIVDLTHDIQPHDIRQAALVIASAYRYFPAGSIHVIVVDPGVGSSRRIVLLETGKHSFLVPDNGVATFLLPHVRQAYHVTQSDLFLPEASTTFHGRDIFAPVAARLLCGLKASQTGRKISPETLKKLPIPLPTIDNNILQGSVVYIDHFGNLITNISKKLLEKFCSGNYRKVTTRISEQKINGVHNSYAEADEGQFVVLINSRGFLEIGMNRNNAAEKLNVALDSQVYLRI